MRAVVATVIAIIITFIVGLVVVGALISSVNRRGWTVQANATWDALISNTWTAFGLLVILPLIVGAVVLLRFFSGGKGGGL